MSSATRALAVLPAAASTSLIVTPSGVRQAGAAGTPEGEGRPGAGTREAGPELPEVRCGRPLGPGHQHV